MGPTNKVQRHVQKTPGCQGNTWTNNKTIDNTLSAITRKELDYQKKLHAVPEKERDQYQSTFLYWTHLSCAFWLPGV